MPKCYQDVPREKWLEPVSKGGKAKKVSGTPHVPYGLSEMLCSRPCYHAVMRNKIKQLPPKKQDGRGKGKSAVAVDLGAVDCRDWKTPLNPDTEGPVLFALLARAFAQLPKGQVDLHLTRPWDVRQ